MDKNELSSQTLSNLETSRKKRYTMIKKNLFFIFQKKMKVNLVGLYSLIASYGYFTVGVLTAWPATALPSIRSEILGRN